MAIMQFHSLVVLLVLLLCGAGGSATPAPAPAAALLTQDNLCVGISTSNGELACLASAALACFAETAITDEVGFTPCFIITALEKECLGKDKEEPNKDHCIGINVNISDQQLSCLGDQAWDCYNSITGHFPLVFIACLQGSAIMCSRQ